MTHNQELKLVKEEQKTSHDKILEAYRRLNEKIDTLIAKRDKKAKTGT